MFPVYSNQSLFTRNERRAMCSQTSALTQTELVERHFLLVPAKVQMDSMVDKEREKVFCFIFYQQMLEKRREEKTFIPVCLSFMAFSVYQSSSTYKFMEKTLVICKYHHRTKG